MAVKLAILKSGEDVVADIQEMVLKDSDGRDKVVGYFFNLPVRAELAGNGPAENSEGGRLPFKIRLTPWMPLSKDERIPVVVDWVISIVEPIDDLKEMYEKGIKRHEDRKSQAAGSDERTEDSDSGGGSSVGVGGTGL